MRGVASYILAGILVVLALDVVAPPAGLGSAFGAWPAVGDPLTQSVNRASKGDRLQVPVTVVEKRVQPSLLSPPSHELLRLQHQLLQPPQPPQPTPPAPVLLGCDPVFSPLAASARANSPARCMA
jgi:hypothetical protein